MCILVPRMFNIPNLFTAGNLLSGVCSIILAFSGQLELACFLIYFAAILDFFDGFLARLLNQKSELGKQLDSLADMVTFGVAPGILVCLVLVIQTTDLRYIPGLTFNEFVGMKIGQFLHLLSFGQWGMINWICLAGLIIPFFSMFRLAKFNIDSRQSESFIGLPTPANTIFFTAFPLLLASNYEQSPNAVLDFLTTPWVLFAITVVMSLLLVAELPLFSLKFKHFKWKGNEVKFVFLLICVVLIPLLLAWSILIIITLYLILSIIENKRQKLTT